MVFDECSDLGMSLKRRIARSLPYPIFRKYADDALDVVSINRVAVDLYKPRTLVFNLHSR
jgi:hypothetical protein